MLGIIHTSDTHARDNIREIIKSLHLRFIDDYLLHTGDMTDQGDKRQYREMHFVMGPFNWSNRLLACPGNHDCFQQQTGLNIFPWRRKGIDIFDSTFNTAFYGLNRPMVDVFEEEKTVVIRLDSNCENLKWSLACGRVGFWQRYWLSELLEKYLGYARIVALHHHPFDRGLGRVLIDSEEFMNVVRGRCEVLCFGHKHEHERCLAAEIEYGIPYILAAGALYEEKRFHRIVVEKKGKRVEVRAEELSL